MLRVGDTDPRGLVNLKSVCVSLCVYCSRRFTWAFKYNLLYQLNDDDDDNDDGGGDEEEEEDENCTSEKIKKSPPSLTHTVLLQNGKENIWSKYINVNKILLISHSP